MIRPIAAGLLVLGLGGCVPMTPEIVAAGLGFGAKALELDTAVINLWAEKRPAPAKDPAQL